MDEEIKKKPSKFKKGLAITGLSLAVLAASNYAGNSFGMRDYIHETVGQGRDAVVSLVTTDVGERAQQLSEQVSKTDDISKYIPELQDAIYTINEKMSPEYQKETIETMLEQASEPVREAVLLNLYTDASPDFRREFNEAIVRRFYEENRSIIAEKWDNFREGTRNLYDSIVERVESWF